MQETDVEINREFGSGYPGGNETNVDFVFKTFQSFGDGLTSAVSCFHPLFFFHRSADERVVKKAQEQHLWLPDAGAV
jgi:hypothetical protein